MYIMYIFATVLFPFMNAKVNKKLSDFIENLDDIEKWKGIEGVYELSARSNNGRKQASFQLCMYVVRHLFCRFGYEALLEFIVI